VDGGKVITTAAVVVGLTLIAAAAVVVFVYWLMGPWKFGPKDWWS